MAGVSLSGLASGLDTEGIIRQLMAIEGQSKLRFVRQEKFATGRKSAMEEVARQLRTLSTAISDLRSTTTWADVQKVTSSDEAKVGARIVGSAPSGNVAVEITQLARAEQRTYAYAEQQNGNSTPQPQEITIDGISVSIPPGSTAQQVADAINGTSGMTVYAGVVNGNLTLTGKEVGKSIAVSSATNSLTEDTAKQVLAQSTLYTINGVQQDPTTASVVRPGGLPGVELTLKAVGTSTLSITAPAVDPETVKTKVKAFVDAYNASLELVRTKLSESKVKNPSLPSEYAKGALRGDPALTTLESRLRQLVQGIDSTATIDTLAEIGVTVEKASSSGTSSANALAGKLTLDADKLARALASAPDDVKALLGGGGATTGVMVDFDAALDPVAKTSTGYLARGAAAADSEASRMRDRQTDMDRRLKLKEERLRAQFTALETALNRSSSQTAWIQGQIAGLPSWGQ